GAAIVTVENWEIGLLRFFTHVVVAEVGNHADNLDVRLRVRPRAAADACAQRIAPRKISAHECFVDDRYTIRVLAVRTGIAVVEIPPGDQADTHQIEETWSDRIHVYDAYGGDALAGVDRHMVLPASANQ